MTDPTFAPLLGALRQNMPPGTLASFLEYAAVEVIGDREPWADDEPEAHGADDPDAVGPAWLWEDFDEPFAPGELPEELPEVDDAAAWDDGFDPTPDDPVTGEPFLVSPDVPEISKDSETPAVAAWCRAVGLNASVVGAWVWCDPYAQPGHDRATLELVLKAAGFQFARRRQTYYHACTIPSSRQPGDKRRGGKLERFHGTSSVVDYVAGKHDARPAWRVAQDAKKARRKK